MRSKIFLLSTAIASIFFASCEKFEEMNENPNEPTVVSADVLLASSQRQSVTTLTEESFLLGNNAAQITAKTLRTEVDAYNWNAFPTVWDGLYNSLTDLKSLENIAVDNGNEKMQGVARVMRAYIFSVLTNAYGDIPYSQAIQGDENNFTPVYDSQEAIYTDLFVELEQGLALLNGEGEISGDLIYGDNADQWIRFTNSLRLRLLMTASGKIPDVAQRFSDIVATGNIIQSNSDNAVLDFLVGFPNQFPLIPQKTGDFDAVALSANMYTALSAKEDPRIARYARPSDDDYDSIDVATDFSGAVNGSNSANCSKSGSRLGPQYYNYPELTTAQSLGLEMANGVMMTYAEVCFLLAEAAEKGWIGNDVETEYRNGIQASMEYHQVDLAPFQWADFNDFYTNSGVAWNNNAMQIWEQKWIALFFHGLQPYFEVRRWYVESGNSFDQIPFLTTPCEDLNGGNLPMRFIYPGEEISLNTSNQIGASENLTDENSKMWLVQ